MTERDMSLDELTIQAYLDGELGDSELIELERHMATSKDLRDRIEREQVERAELQELLTAPKPPVSLGRAIRARLAEEDRATRRRRWREALAWSLPGGATAAAVAAIALFLTAPNEPKPANDSMMAAAGRQHFAAPTVSPVVASPERHEVSASLGRYLASPVSLPSFSGGRATLQSWSPAQLMGRQAAELRYSLSTNTGQHGVTVHVFNARDIELSGKRKMDVSGQTLWLDSPFGLSAVSLIDDRGIGYIFTSGMPESELIELVISDRLQR